MKALEALPEHEVLTPDEVASFLRVSAGLLESEIVAGRLQAIRIGSELRILKQDLLEFLELARRRDGKSPLSTGPTQPILPAVGWFDLQLKPSEAFSYKWPNVEQEQYTEALGGTVHAGDGVKTVQVGFTEREAAGKLRERAVVFIDKRPVVEFVGSNDFDNSGLMVSLLKHKNGRQVRPAERIPPEYRHMTIEPYNKYVTGPYASSNLAVICPRNDLSTMVEHALLRLKAGARR